MSIQLRTLREEDNLWARKDTIYIAFLEEHNLSRSIFYYIFWTSEKRTTAIERIVCNFTFLDLQEEDNLSIVDQIAGPNVSFIQRFHCT